MESKKPPQGSQDAKNPRDADKTESANTDNGSNPKHQPEPALPRPAGGYGPAPSLAPAGTRVQYEANPGRGKALAQSDGDVADLFALTYRGRLLYDHARGSWYELDPRMRIWRPLNCAEEVGYIEGCITSSGKRQWGKVRGALQLAKSRPAISADERQFDQNRNLVGTPDGIWDLRTGREYEGEDDPFVTKTLAVAPADEPSSLLARCMREWCGDDDETFLTLMAFCGLALSGETKEQKFAFLYGPGRNGKSVLVELLAWILGDYHIAVDMEMFMSNRYGRQHPNEIAQLDGPRLVTAAETKRKREWNDELVKNLTGGDTIRARFLYQEHFSFKPQFKLLLHGNFRPKISDVGLSMRRRLLLVPFDWTPPNPDPDLLAKLKEDGPRVLRSLMLGFKEWREHGLGVDPGSRIHEASAEYFDAEDHMSVFIQECCETGADHYAHAGLLLKAYTEWAKDTGGREYSARGFAEELKRKGFKGGEYKYFPEMKRNARAWCGLKLLGQAETGNMYPAR